MDSSASPHSMLLFEAYRCCEKDFATERIEIAFNPLTGRFDVPDVAVKRDKRFIRNISCSLGLGNKPYPVRGRLHRGAKKTFPMVSIQRCCEGPNRSWKLHSFLHFPFTVLEIAAQVDADQVAEVFVRINSEGKLNQSDFILTLMSVFWDEGRSQLEDFSRQARVPNATGGASPYNHYFQPDPDSCG